MTGESGENRRRSKEYVQLCARRLFPLEKANEMASEVCQICEKGKSSKWRYKLIDGKPAKSVVSGLLHLVGFRHGCPAGTKEIAQVLGTTSGTVVKSYNRWLDYCPEMFPEFERKSTGHGSNYQLVYHPDWAD